jgi:hypothetical protein
MAVVSMPLFICVVFDSGVSEMSMIATKGSTPWCINTGLKQRRLCTTSQLLPNQRAGHVNRELRPLLPRSAGGRPVPPGMGQPARVRLLTRFHLGRR